MLHFRTSTMLLAVVIFTAGCAGEVPAVVEATDPAPALSADPITDGLVAHRPAVPGVHGLITAGHPLAAMAGMRILMQGGTAADAARARGGAGDPEPGRADDVGRRWQWLHDDL